MTIRVDPEGIENCTLFDLVDFSDKRVLEIGCGDGRLTWRYADGAAHVTAIDPNADKIAMARQQMPEHLLGHVEFHASAFEDFVADRMPATFDIVILSWAL